MVKAGVVIFPGTNCEEETYEILDFVGFDVEYLWYKDTVLRKYELIVLPGGFSYGDYLRPGAIARFSPLMDKLRDYVEKEWGLVLGICNGFQILTEAGFLEGVLLVNKNGKFVCKWVELLVENNDSPFTLLYERGETVRMPIAHREGRYYVDAGKLYTIEMENRVSFRYKKENPNGSLSAVAGLLNSKKNVLGLMPHPERASFSFQGGVDGLRVFRSIYEFLKKSY